MGAAEATKAAGRFAIDSIKDYADFEGTLKQVQIIAGGTQADMDMLGDTAIEIGGKTSKGAQEVAEAMVDFAKLGFTAKETSEAMKGIVYAAEASGSGVQETAGIVATALNVWNMEASKAEHVADVLAKTANETAS
ncbi:tail length tape measure protein [Enterococcus phage EF_FB]